MNAFAACLFALSALASLLTIGFSWHRFGRSALALRAELAACPLTMTVHWKTAERTPLPARAGFRPDRAARPDRRKAQASGLEWPALALAA